MLFFWISTLFLLLLLRFLFFPSISTFFVSPVAAIRFLSGESPKPTNEVWIEGERQWRRKRRTKERKRDGEEKGERRRGLGWKEQGKQSEFLRKKEPEQREEQQRKKTRRKGTKETRRQGKKGEKRKKNKSKKRIGEDKEGGDEEGEEGEGEEKK